MIFFPIPVIEEEETMHWNKILFVIYYSIDNILFR